VEVFGDVVSRERGKVDRHGRLLGRGFRGKDTRGADMDYQGSLGLSSVLLG
jgi:hypothetical protein